MMIDDGGGLRRQVVRREMFDFAKTDDTTSLVELFHNLKA